MEQHALETHCHAVLKRDELLRGSLGLLSVPPSRACLLQAGEVDVNRHWTLRSAFARRCSAPRGRSGAMLRPRGRCGVLRPGVHSRGRRRGRAAGRLLRAAWSHTGPSAAWRHAWPRDPARGSEERLRHARPPPRVLRLLRRLRSHGGGGRGHRGAHAEERGLVHAGAAALEVSRHRRTQHLELLAFLGPGLWRRVPHGAALCRRLGRVSRP